ncbi:S-adenosylmethionine decarboxylase proenzyme [compost metagenome]
MLSAHFHHFGAGAGVTGVVMLSESHISIHSWPEHRFAALDIFMCGTARPELALAHLQAQLAPESVHVTTVARG